MISLKKICLFAFIFCHLFSCSNLVLTDLKFQSPKKENKILTLKFARDIDPFYRTGKLPIGFNGGVFAGNDFYYGTESGELIKLSVDSGKSVVVLKDKVGFLGAPVVSSGNIFITTINGEILSVSQSSGKVNFRQQLGAPSEGGFQIIQKKIILTLRSHAVVVLAEEDGHLIWAYRRPVSSTISLHRKSSALVKSNQLFVGFADGNLVSFGLEKGEILWEKKVAEGESRQFQDVLMTPFVVDGKIWVATYQGVLKVLDLTNGNLLKLAQVKPVTDFIQFNNKLVVGTAEGKIVILSEQAQILSELSVAVDIPIAQIGIWNKKLLTLDHTGVLRVFDFDHLKKLDQFQLGHSYSTSFTPFAIGDKFFGLISTRNKVYLF